MKKIRKAVIPAAGYGTRFLPATKAQPKEMLPIVDKPIIQYVVEDAVSAGIEDIVIVTGWLKRSIEDHFDYPYELEKRLEEAGKHEEIEQIRSIANMANFFYVRQKGPVGNATPILNAREIIGDEPFLVLWGDDFIDASPSRASQLIEAYNSYGGAAMLGSIRTSRPEDYKRYAYATGVEIQSGILEIESIIEKPGMNGVATNYACVSGTVYGPEIFPAIEEATKRIQNSNTPREVIYVDAVNILLEQGKKCYAKEIKGGKYHDCGNKLEYLKTVVEFGLKHEDISEGFSSFLKNMKL
ncbi:MAG: UTP--glucose-1-phosphate uridylyltransferase [Candidatus Taylorbacteria bacterium RIFCSPLOWO2_12_FULL_43_20]|uniref:UTP--glucose-1-phosphate uridylyltransferase n=1 Tax=Candidatus Taylorbacteria bacterium RIFCSPLOWO2_12_FULL_43_20 TaxID=1802332 RepID=A0A1G2P3R4_9BACT|nr:MAG: UTP--glucose-1-phosphate uridylyltransferase [Candidatus Taylorbacteria bacterium RIFCSPHIGHO2_01_FULL_43_120]OHA23006.1 MAG: UTP--glucose-1-phosphate uridylyltransferase [Candidatus Taylorbacteria bacterium RIFCSPHIGHO2_02_FULL_43_55]OHA30122.1 MAG: UTP--glucose-1-phosphate uridylyltransferase [Candidatus Taylorbacteria bacterium RIFCSPHIGHO2_12_FULL_42_34]OHA30720.1 MAG: UTP--glucose-1-phosphate uridylyltransferase [Candidatus Taylorbacteria bacterium RIFCSPLOWO2_01_FULL_43_83]OHA3959